MRRDVRCGRLIRAGTRQAPPQRKRTQAVVGAERHRDCEGRERHASAGVSSGQSACAEDRGDDQRRNQPGRVVVVDRGLRVRGREQVESQLRDRRDEDERCGRKEEREREQELGEVADPLPVERGDQQPVGTGKSGVEDPARRAAERAVAHVEIGWRAVVEVRQDEPDRDGGDDGADQDDRSAGSKASSRERVPEAHAREHERDFLLRQRGEPSEDGEGNEAVLVEVPEGKKQQRARERDGVELAQGQPLDGRVEEVREREAEAGPFGAEVLPGEPEHG